MNKFRILFLSDAAYPLSNTGFGIVAGQLLHGLVQSNKFDIVHLGRGIAGKDVRDLASAQGYRFAPPPLNDPNGYGYVQYLCELEKPHLVCIAADPGSIHEWRKNVEMRRIPNLVHTPVEGAPLLSPWSDAVSEVLVSPSAGRRHGYITTYTNFGKRTIDTAILRGHPERQDLPMTEVLPLGVDHANFRKYSPAERDKIRARLNWTDKFVVMNVARNAQRKNWPQLLKAIRLLKYAHPNLILYAHTVPFENYFLQGHNLMNLAVEYGIQDHIQFMSDIRDATTGIAFDDNPNGLTLIDMYNAADLFVSPSSGEGWNLPQTEAAACGLPVACTEYSGGWEVAENFAYPIPVRDFDTHVTGLEMAHVFPEDIAAVIEHLMRNPSKLKQMRDDGMAVTAGYTWERTVQRFTKLAEEICLFNA